MKKLFKISFILMVLIMTFTIMVPTHCAAITAEINIDTLLANLSSYGEKEVSEVIKSIKPSGFQASSYSYTKIKCSWDEITGLDGYIVYRATSKSGKYSKVFSTDNDSKTSYINTGRTTGKTYYYKVRGYVKINNKTYYTKYSNVDSAYARPSKVKNVSAYLSDNNIDFIVDWDKVSGASGYEVAVKQDGDTKWRKGWYYKPGNTYLDTIYVGDIKINGTEARIDLGDANYQFKVRAYHIENGKKVYGLYSAPICPVQKVTLDEIKKAAEDYVISKYPNTKFYSKAEALNKTPENSGWGATWPMGFSKYMSIDVIMDDFLADALDYYAESFWGNTGYPSGCIYVREVDNCYSIWWLN